MCLVLAVSRSHSLFTHSFESATIIFARQACELNGVGAFALELRIAHQLSTASLVAFPVMELARPDLDRAVGWRAYR